VLAAAETAVTLLWKEKGDWVGGQNSIVGE
jgi:hypothetical protein